MLLLMVNITIAEVSEDREVQRGGGGLAESTGGMMRGSDRGFLSWIFKNELVCVGRIRQARPPNQMEQRHVQRLKCIKLTHALENSLV